MVQLSAYMVAIAAMMMGLDALEISSVKAIQRSLAAADIIPSASSFAAAADSSFAAAAESSSFAAAAESSSSLVEDDLIQAEGLLDDIADFLNGGLKDLPIPSFSIGGPAAKISGFPTIPGLPSISIGTGEDDESVNKIPASPLPSGTKKIGKRAIYDLQDDEEVESKEFEIPVSNAYSAQDAASSSADAPVAAASVFHSHSVKAVLRARGGIKAAQLLSASISAAGAEPSNSYFEEKSVQANGIIENDIADKIRSNIKASLSNNFIAVSSEESDSPVTAAAGKDLYFSDFLDPAVRASVGRDLLFSLIKGFEQNSKELEHLKSVINDKIKTEALP